MMEKTYWYKEYSQGRRFFLKILPGQSLVDNIKNLVLRENIKSSVILSAIGCRGLPASLSLTARRA